ncbi:MAG: DUF349 domain-containing protein [Cellvibrionales bacterium]|nr:DUF349 domain-containing protein [Cellvibrionales bacterium]
MFKQLFKPSFKPSLKPSLKPKWQHKDPEVRVKALEQLNKDHLETLVTLIHEDAESSVRLAAFTKLPSIDDLLTHYNSTPHSSDKPDFSKHILQRLDDQYKLQSFKEDTISLLKNHDFFDTFVQQTGNAALLDQIANAFSPHESDQLALIKNTKQHSIRTKLIGQLETETALREAWQWLKSRDKTAAKACKQRLDALQSEKKLREKQQQKAELILQKLQDCQNKHQKSPLASIMDVQQKAFAQLDQSLISSDTITAIHQAISDIESRLAKEAADQAQATHANEQAAKYKQVISKLDEQIAKAEQAIGQLVSPDAQHIDNILISIKQNIIQKLGDKPLAKDPQGQKLILLEKRLANYKHTFTLLLQASEIDTNDVSIDQVKQSIVKLSQFEKNLADAPALNQQIRHGIDRLNAYLTKCKHEQKGILKLYLEHIKKVSTAVNDKQLTDAQKYMQIAKRQFKRLDQTNHSKHQAEHSRLEKSIVELKQWKRFSTDPVRERLIQSMQALVDDSTIAPDERAKTIKQLQSEWRSLGYSEDQTLWDNFQSLAKEAYRPCKEAFNEEKTQRAFNLEQRLIICEEIEGFIEKTHWHLTDYKALDKLLSNILNEWSKYSPVERSEHAKTQERFSKSVDFIKEKLKLHKTDNLNQLATLVEKASALLEETDADTALKTHQGLLNQWKKIGITFRSDQQKLWQQFKEIGDTLYSRKKQKRQAEKKDHADRLDYISDKKNQMQRLIDDANNSDIATNPIELKSAFNALKHECLTVENISPKESERLKQTLEKLTVNLDTILAKRKRHEWVSQFSAFDEYLETLKKAEHENTETAEAQNLLPKKWQAKVMAANQRFSAPESNSLTIGEALCIELEILANQETPAHNQQQRIDMQIQTLKKNFGNNTKDTNVSKNERIEELYCEFFGLPQAFLQTNGALVDRFIASGNAFLNSL